MQLECGDIKNAGSLNFVAAWFVKAAQRSMDTSPPYSRNDYVDGGIESAVQVAQQALGKTVDAVHNYKGLSADAACVAILFERYQVIASFLPSVVKVKKLGNYCSSGP